MPTTTISFTLTANNREDIRNELVNLFLQEQAGTGKGDDTSVYIYEVETLQNGETIYLKRPARLNKGFDFEVNVSNTSFGTGRRTTMPSYQHIHDDLLLKKDEDPIEFTKLKGTIEKIYLCQNVTDAEMLGFAFTRGFPTDLLLKVIKWLFIEQDITYWNWSGRGMFYSYLSSL
jgi:hypothetical protein